MTTTSDSPQLWLVVRICESGFVEVRTVSDLSHLQAASKATGLRVPVAGFRYQPVESVKLLHSLEPFWTEPEYLTQPAAAGWYGSARMDPEVQVVLRRLLRHHPEKTTALVAEWRRAVEAVAK